MAAVHNLRKKRTTLISGNANITIRKANENDLDAIKTLADAHRVELGFVRRPTLLEAIRRGEIIIAQNSKHIAGFVHYHHRRDTQTTLYDIAVKPDYRLAGIGKTLIYALISEAQTLGKQTILLKCPEELSANAFYASLGFERWQDDPGKRRRLIVWKLDIKAGELTACIGQEIVTIVDG